MQPALKAVQSRIHFVRGERVMLSADLAEIYGVETRALNQAVKRNAARFPGDFMFQITAKEVDDLISQTVTSSWGGARRALPLPSAAPHAVSVRPADYGSLSLTSVDSSPATRHSLPPTA
jgi:hypothetical protein